MTDNANNVTNLGSGANLISRMGADGKAHLLYRSPKTVEAKRKEMESIQVTARLLIGLCISEGIDRDGLVKAVSDLAQYAERIDKELHLSVPKVTPLDRDVNAWAMECLAKSTLIYAASLRVNQPWGAHND